MIQEANGPQLAHLSEIVTADMQMLCNIFSILSLQLMKRSSFEKFLVLKKNVFWGFFEEECVLFVCFFYYHYFTI